MSSDDRIRQSGAFRNPMLILGIVMTIFYVGLGAFILLNRAFLAHIQLEFRQAFAVMLIIYGVYRGWRTYANN